MVSRAVVRGFFPLYKITLLSDKVKKMCQTVFFDLFWIALMCKELNSLEHMLYEREEVTNVCR